MGVLTMGFIKIMQGKNVRSLQHKLARISRQIQRAQKDYARQEKMLNSAKRNELNNLNMFGQMEQFGISTAAQAKDLEIRTSVFGKDMASKAYQDMSDTEKQEYMSKLPSYQMMASQYNSEISSMKQLSQSMLAQQKSAIEDKYEMLTESTLQPLKDLEEDLMLEKETIESQLKLAQEDYNAAKQAEQQDAKNFAPQYTGQG